MLNRVNHNNYSDDICSVVKEPWQFSWHNYSPLRDVPISEWQWYMDDLYHNSMSSKDKRIWIKILNESLSAYIFRGYDVTDGSLWYMTVDRYSERGGWLGTKPHKVVGSHIFFKPTYYASKGG